ncbi:MAG: methyltransferase domain-containing protein [Candidatus Wallbacteria bacterium]|nr:methyltransferase domain-containing protein [Candidatus Wallbacteria bacterium]
MRARLLDFLCCPGCKAAFRVDEREREDDEILEGELVCTGCGVRYPVTRGVPRILPAELRQETRQSAINFGGSWERFGSLKEAYRNQFLDWIRFHSLDEEFFRDKVILDFGCGKGRHSYLSSRFGAKEVIGIDVSSAVDVAYRNTRHLRNVHILQTDIYALPLKAATFDYVFSIGVLHHLPAPEQGFRIALSMVRPGGSISIWVYGRENNGWIIYGVNPIRSLTSKLPLELLYWLSVPLALLLHSILQLIYQPLDDLAPSLAKHLFYRDYLLYISQFNFNEIHHIIVDHLTAPVAYYLRREEVEAWFHRAGVQHVMMRWHNANSWSALCHDCNLDPRQLVRSAVIEADSESPARALQTRVP